MMKDEVQPSPRVEIGRTKELGLYIVLCLRLEIDPLLSAAYQNICLIFADFLNFSETSKPSQGPCK